MTSDALLARLTVDPAQCGGKPCIRGKRLRVTDVLDLLANGATLEDVLTNYPSLDRDDIRAALAYAARQTGHAA